MELDIREYSKMLNEKNVDLIYSGPLWAGCIDGLAELLLKRLEFDNIPFAKAQSVFSVFVEQLNNMLLYSADKEYKETPEKEPQAVSRGVFALAAEGTTYYIHTGNVVTDNNADILKLRIDHLNALDKDEIRDYHKQQLKAENYNPESRGAGIGLTEVARRASGPVSYSFEPIGDGLQFFSMRIAIQP